MSKFTEGLGDDAEAGWGWFRKWIKLNPLSGFFTGIVTGAVLLLCVQYVASWFA